MTDRIKENVVVVLAIVVWFAIVLGLTWYGEVQAFKLATLLGILALIAPIVLLSFLVGTYGDGNEGP